MANKQAVFKVKVHEIKQALQLDDEFAKDVSEFDTLDEYKEDLKKQLLTRKEQEAQGVRENEAVERLTLKLKFLTL